MDYQEALAKLNQFQSNEIRLGLERITLLLEMMGNPQDQLRFIHVAGTNGKGSTSKMIATMLTRGGYKTGLYLSPYVLEFREQFQIDGKMVLEAEFAQAAQKVYRQLDLIKPEMKPSYFEIQTAIAFEWYCQSDCDYVVLEVGLGGRLDATNVIKTAVVQVITAISFDHTAFLGDTLTKIAIEKAGIIKGAPTIIYPDNPTEVNEVIISRCQETGADYVVPDLTKLQIKDENWQYSDFSYDGVAYHKSLPGQYQIYNCLMAIEAAKKLRDLGVSLSQEDIGFGVEYTTFPARMEMIAEHPLILLDGAHNPAGANSLAMSLAKMDQSKVTLMMGVLADKDYRTILATLAPHAKALVAVAPANPRALSAPELAVAAQEYCDDVLAYDHIDAAVEAVLANLSTDETLVVCGSLYLALEVRPLLLKITDS